MRPPFPEGESLRGAQAVGYKFDVIPSFLVVRMSSSRLLKRQRLAAETCSSGIEMAPCSACRNARTKSGQPKPRCIVGTRSGRCSECIRKGLAHCDVTVSRPEWERLRDGREKLRAELEAAEEREAEMMHKLFEHRSKTLRLRKQLRQAEKRTDHAVAKELEELEGAEAVENEFLDPTPSSSVVAPSDPWHEFLHGAEAEPQPVPFWDVVEMPPGDWDLLLGETGAAVSGSVEGVS